MSIKTTALLIGGFLPAFIYGGSAIFQKLSTNIGISISMYLIAVGIGVMIAGIGFYFLDNTTAFSIKASSYAGIFGLTWGIASGLVAYSLLNFNVPISQLIPLYNMNTLVAVLLALLIFSEWKDLHTIKLISGSVLIVIGAIFVANA
ncbi:MAG: hypothetical protein KJO81_01980 [Gammaproteobacteria bacterium]|nr:hypothetical protein [Gammaproteobacteria bacterium]NNC66664.1 hypothetical protein [Gammaproteobacteria bacterium]